MGFVYVHFVILIKMEDFVSNYIIEDEMNPKLSKYHKTRLSEFEFIRQVKCIPPFPILSNKLMTQGE